MWIFGVVWFLGGVFRGVVLVLGGVVFSKRNFKVSIGKVVIMRS